MAAENLLWGHRRVQAELARLGFTVSARTVARYMRRSYHGVPSPRPVPIVGRRLLVPPVYSPAASALNFRLARWMMAAMITLILTGLLRGVRTRRALVLENVALRHQLAVLQRTARRPRLRRSDRVFWALLSHLWRGWAETVSIVHPETVIRWHRAGFKLFWTRKSRRHGPGRPAVAPEVRALIRTMAHANPLWGAPRITGSS